MTIKKSSVENETSPLRIPKAKNKLGLQIRNVPNIRMPHDDLIVSEKPDLKVVEGNETKSTTIPSQTSQSSQTSQTSQSKAYTEVAPTKNFQKVANSISKQAVPEGWFKGKSKQLYDALYSLTRGAINPSRKVRIQKSKLMKLAAIGSRITFDANVRHLAAVGLIIETVYAGEHEGNEFEVLLPEELTLTSQSSQTSVTSSAQKLDRLVSLETSQTSQSINSIDATISLDSKTLFKTNTNDDEGFAKFIEIFNQAALEITGKKITASDRDKMESLAELLVLELRTAARRTENVSNVPAFLTEVLRRQFFVVHQQGPTQNKKKSAEKSNSLEVGRNDAGEYEIKQLDEQGREAALAELKEFAGDPLLEDFKKWYTEKDWEWLLKHLRKE